MNSKLLILLLSLCCLFLTSTVKANSNVLNNTKVVEMAWDDTYFDIPRGSTGGSRSAIPAVPILVSHDGNQINLNFIVPVGEIEITISQDGAPVYSSSENILSPVVKDIQLSQESGTFLLEIRGANGAYAYGWFTL